MLILATPIAPLNSFADSLRRLRADTQALADRSSNLGSGFGSLQQLAYDCSNRCHDAYEHAWDASSDTGAIDSSAHGAAIGATVGTLTASQEQLTTSSGSATGEAGFCRGEIERLSSALTALAASAPQGPLAATLQEALAQLGQAQTQQSSVSFDDSAQLAQTQALLQSVSAEAATIAADVPGGDVSGSAKAAMSELQTAQFTYGQIGTLAYRNGLAELDAAQSCHSAVSTLDVAISQLPPDPPTPEPPAPEPGQQA